ncbi:MAG: valine--tRNA ligase [Fimbriimonadaceae bacterium]|nr:valine--tRNA ligase [Fimbriimonadaceae bacterium]
MTRKRGRMKLQAIEGAYAAQELEQRWYAAWEAAGLFEANIQPDKPVYSITIPPPNITGSLHMGHALCYPLQDLLGRYKRMRGFDVLILPGLDHAGIATQSVVEKQLKKEGSSGVKIGRDAFLDRVWKWRDESGGTILEQFRRLGLGFDWGRERFTLDEKYADAVLKVFIDWFDRGLIYKGLRVVNWDPVLQTSVSDIETERRDIKGNLYHIRYPFADGSGHVTIATTRPETMLADVAVAVHPSDKRYTQLIGKKITLPLVGREIPLVADPYPDPAFGTGAVKITPGHDANDFEVGVRQELETLVIFDPTGKVNAEGPYFGLDRKVARDRVVADLESGGFLEKIEPHDIALVVSQRSGEPVEPLASEQWFVRQSELAKPAADATREGRIKFVPERYAEEFTEWLDNIRDWCISRQLWWGHRIPVYYTEDGEAFAALNQADAERKAGRPIVRQDDDVLDTWFSSGLWPFATLGWPDQTPELERYYPTSVLVTSRDILYLWVARMAMMGLDFLKEIPFSEVYIYATILTKDGKRMSKSLGTGIDPLEVIETKGADALRHGLFSQTGYNQAIRYDEKRAIESGHFCNKIWNASRFIQKNLEGYKGDEPAEFDTVDRWILSRLAETTQKVTEAIDAYHIQAASEALYEFFWYEFADWYIEASKPRLADPAQRHVPQWVLMRCLDVFLRLLHPFLPFISEELAHRMGFVADGDFLLKQSWPEAALMLSDKAAESQVNGWIEQVRGVRALRAELGIAAMKTLPTLFVAGDLSSGADFVASQAWFTSLEPGSPTGVAVSTTVGGVDFHLPVEGLVDTESELARLRKEQEKLGAERSKISQRLDSPDFVSRAKPEVIERDRSRVAEIDSILEKTSERITLFGG